MKKTILTLVLVLSVVAVLQVLRTSSKIQEPIRYPTQDRLQWYAKKTKDEGKTRVRVPGPIIDYAGVDIGLEEALRNYSAVVGEIIGNASYIVNSEDVMTWYKFKTLDTLSHKGYVYCHTCAPIPDVPEEIGPVSHDEFLLPVSGGTVIVDGVELTMENTSIPPFETGKKYLLFVTLTPSKVAVLAAGPSGIFQVNDDHSLQSVNTKPSPLQTQIKQRFNFSLSKLKAQVKDLSRLKMP